jgi:hypothetical protein
VVSLPGSGEEVTRVAVKKSRYRVTVEPGIYRVQAIAYPMQDSLCWEGRSRRVRVGEGEIRRLRLSVENICVV